MCWFISLSRILLQGSVLMNLVERKKQQVHCRKDEVGIQRFGNICLMTDIIPPGVRISPVLGPHPSLRICFLVYLSLLHEFRSPGIGFGLRIFAISPEQENIFEAVKTMQLILHVAQSCIIMRCMLSITRGV
jgi:hypothetical protein